MGRRGLLIALIVSVAVNLFAVGAVVGALVLGPRMHMVVRGPPFWTAAAELPPARREAYRKMLRSDAGEVREAMREARRARRDAWRSLGEPDSQPSAVAARLDHARQLEMRARSMVERRILDFAATLPPEERAILAEGLAKSGPRFRREGRPPGP
jgi:uncharacterized membrane protein